MTDEAVVHEKIGTEFKGHGTVNHSADEYSRLGGFITTNSVESFFALLKRGVYGSYFHVSEAHLHRYLAEADFRYNHREKLGFEPRRVSRRPQRLREWGDGDDEEACEGAPGRTARAR